MMHIWYINIRTILTEKPPLGQALWGRRGPTVLQKWVRVHESNGILTLYHNAWKTFDLFELSENLTALLTDLYLAS